MDEPVEKAMVALRQTLKPGYSKSAKFVVAGLGMLCIAEGQVTGEDRPCDCTLTASLEDFRSMLSGDLSPQTAFMTGRLKVDGDFGAAMELAGHLR